MDGIKGYILTVITAALIASVAVGVLGKNGLHGTMIKLLAGLFLSVTVISPLAKIQFRNLSSYFSDLNVDASAIITEAEEEVLNAKREIIIDQVEAYILDEATKLGLDLSVTVSISDDTSLVPDRITITGNASPYKKTRLQTWITSDLGIPEEQQVWA